MFKPSDAADQLRADHPAWEIWYVPMATGKPVITWHARQWSETTIIHADSAGDLDALIRRMPLLRSGSVVLGRFQRTRPGQGHLL